MTAEQHRDQVLQRIGALTAECAMIMSLPGALPLVTQTLGDAALLHHAAGRKEKADQLLGIVGHLRKLGDATAELIRLPEG